MPDWTSPQAEQAGKQRSDLEQSIASLNAEKDRLTVEIAEVGQKMPQAQDGLASTQNDLASARSDRDLVTSEPGQAEQNVPKLAADREGAASASEAIQKRQAEAQIQLAELTETMAARNQEIAGLEDRLGGDAPATRRRAGKVGRCPSEAFCAGDNAEPSRCRVFARKQTSGFPPIPIIRNGFRNCREADALNVREGLIPAVDDHLL